MTTPGTGPRTLVEIAAFGADAKRAEKLGVTVGGELVEANRPSSGDEEAVGRVRLGLERVEEQVTHDPDPQVQAGPAGARLAAQRQQAWAGEVD